MLGLTIIKRFTYRGDTTEEFSNTYWLSGSTPASDAGWRTVFDEVVAVEKQVYPATVSVIRGYGYDGFTVDADGKVNPNDSVFSVDLTASPNTPVAGTLTISGGIQAPGDSAVWVRWKTSRRSSGKPIYLRKYFHPAMLGAAAKDDLAGQQTTALNALGTALQTTGLTNGGTIINPKHPTDTILGHGASVFATTRTLKRRGKRPPTG